MSIICAIMVTVNDKNLFSHFYIAATFLEKQLNCFTQAEDFKGQKFT